MMNPLELISKHRGGIQLERHRTHMQDYPVRVRETGRSGQERRENGGDVQLFALIYHNP